MSEIQDYFSFSCLTPSNYLEGSISKGRDFRAPTNENVNIQPSNQSQVPNDFFIQQFVVTLKAVWVTMIIQSQEVDAERDTLGQP